MAYKSIKVKIANQWYSINVGDTSHSPVEVIVDGETYHIQVDGLPQVTVSHQSVSHQKYNKSAIQQTNSDSSHKSDKIMTSPMPGRVVAVNVRPGDSVSTGHIVCVIEAMKMEQNIETHISGIIKKIHVLPMQQVGYGDILVELE